MPVTRLSAADRKAIVADILASLAGATAPVVSAPVPPTPATEHIGPSGKPDGRRFPCTAPDGSCGRLLRSAKRAAEHATGAALADRGHQRA